MKTNVTKTDLSGGLLSRLVFRLTAFLLGWRLVKFPSTAYPLVFWPQGGTPAPPFTCLTCSYQGKANTLGPLRSHPEGEQAHQLRASTLLPGQVQLVGLLESCAQKTIPRLSSQLSWLAKEVNMQWQPPSRKANSRKLTFESHRLDGEHRHLHTKQAGV
jgi:hypothetical protein